jgi:hypothetical protein
MMKSSVEAGPDPLVAAAGLPDGADGSALGRRAAAAAGGGEERGEIGVEVDDAADVVVELPDEADVAGEVAGHLGLVVLVDLVDEDAVLVQQALHLHEARLERVQDLGVHAGPRAAAAAAEPRQRRLAALHDGIGCALSSPFPLAPLRRLVAGVLRLNSWRTCQLLQSLQ